jgi:1-acyl-sn-glycerol-3-phosphate acyltransferase
MRKAGVHGRGAGIGPYLYGTCECAGGRCMLESTELKRDRIDDEAPAPTARDESPIEPPERWSGVHADPSSLSVAPFLPFATLLRRYHRYRVLHLERLGRLITSGRRVIVVSNHALDMIDPILFIAAVLQRYERIPRFIGHENLVFRIPGLRSVARNWRVIPSRQPEETARAIEQDRFLMLFPGSGTEALMRDYRREPYRLRWESRTGFLRLALEHDAEIVFAATVGNAGDAARYRGARLQFGMLGPHLLPALLPFPVQLTHVVSEPLDLGERERALHDERAFEELHAHVWSRCQRFLDRAVGRQRGRADWLDRGVRACAGLARTLGL